MKTHEILGLALLGVCVISIISLSWGVHRINRRAKDHFRSK